MTAAAANWVWTNSRATNGSLIVLLAIADELDAKGNCVMSLPELVRKTRLSDRAVRNGVADLMRLGELEVLSGGSGRGNRTAYGLPANLAESATFEGCKGEESATFEPETRQNLPPLNPAESATFSPPQTVKPQARPRNLADSAGPEIPDALNGSVVSGNRSKPRRASETPRLDVDRLCEHLAGRIEANGSKRPAIGKRWKDAARLLIDNDGRSEDDIHKAIDWCQQHHFWHRQILSMEKLRQQYDRLRLDAKAEREQKTRPAQNGHQPTHDEFEALRQNWARPLDAQEAGIDTRGNGRPDRVHSRVLPAAENRQDHSGRLV